MNASTRAIVHIGLPKTGSTTIQAFLQRNRRSLARRGMAYRRYPAGWPNQSELAVAALAAIGQAIPEEHVRRASGLTDGTRQQAFAARYEAWVDATPSAPVTLFCCEILSTWLTTAEQVAALHRWLCQRFGAVCYIIYLRRPEDWLLSEYSQRIRNGAALPLQDFLAEMPLPRAADLLALWRSVVGGALDVRLMERAALVDGDLLADFCAAAGIEPAGLSRVSASNRQLSLPAASAIRKVNALTHRLVPHDPSRRALRKVARLVIETVAPRQPALSLSADQRETLRRRTEDDVTTLAPAMTRNRPFGPCAAPALPARQDANKGNPPWPF